MFKKTLVAAALVGAFVGSAFAANVSLYGKVDLGLQYDHSKQEGFVSGATYDSQNTFQLNSGVDSSSRWGLKGSEELGNGYTVSFKLESGFNADDGTLQKNRLFQRESSLTVSGPFGALSAGRMGGVDSAAGTYDVVYAIGDALDGGGTLDFNFQTSARYDNVLTYQTPKFAGVQATAQYSFKNDNTNTVGVEGKNSADRYAGFALTGEFGNFQGVVAYARQIRSNVTYANQDDQNTYYLGGNYDFGVAKVFALAQYYTGALSAGAGSAWNVNDWSVDHDATFSNLDSKDGFKGYGLHLGTVVPVAGGDATFALYYNHAKADDYQNGREAVDFKVNSYGAVARYEYPISKRTTVYTGVEYYHDKAELSNAGFASYQDGKQTNVGAYLGLIHNF